MNALPQLSNKITSIFLNYKIKKPVLLITQYIWLNKVTQYKNKPKNSIDCKQTLWNIKYLIKNRNTNAKGLHVSPTVAISKRVNINVYKKAIHMPDATRGFQPCPFKLLMQII